MVLPINTFRKTESGRLSCYVKSFVGCPLSRVPSLKYHNFTPACCFVILSTSHFKRCEQWWIFDILYV